MDYSHACFGSRLHISVSSEEDISLEIEKCFSMVDQFEQKYSRFIQGNFLSKLNREKSAHIDSEFESLLKLSLKVSQLSQWYFDITLLPILENLGYGINSDVLDETYGYENIILWDHHVELQNDVSIDIGAVWKWYMVDKIFNILTLHAQAFTINFWGDIRVKGRETIYLEDPIDQKKSIGNIVLENISIASSAGNKRTFGKNHHLINAKTKQSQNDKLTLYVTHKLSSFSDIFSTALFVSPLELSLKILEQTPGLEALIIASDGAIYKSRWFTAHLNTKKAWQ